MKKTFLRFLSTALAMMLLVSMIPAQALERGVIYTESEDVEAEILEENLFYFAASQFSLRESDGNSYAIRIGRGGDCESAASVTVQFGDINARYGKDYTAGLLDGGSARKKDDALSVTDLMSGEYSVIPMGEEETLESELSENAELRSDAAAAINDAIRYVEEKAELAPYNEDGTAVTYSEIVEEAEKIYASPLQQARALATGLDGETQHVTGSDDYDDYQDEIQRVSDLISGYLVSAELTVEFAPGVSERWIVITPKDNKTSDGSRYFSAKLTHPENADVSIRSDCLVTILDNEEVLPCEVSFGDVTVNEDSVTVNVVREGCLNQITHLKLKTTEKGNAVKSRDYAPVDTDILFPMSIPETQVVIPVNTEYLNGEADFELELEPVQNAEVEDSSLNVTLNGTAGAAGVLKAASGEVAVDRNLGTVAVVTDSAVNFESALKYHTANYDGYNGIDGDAYRMRWEYDTIFSTNWSGKVAAAFNLISDPLVYSGAQVDMKKEGSCSSLTVGFGTPAQCRNTACSVDGLGRAYESAAGISRQTVNFYDPRDPSDPKVSDYATYIKFLYTSGCRDCDNMYLYSFKPIYRWYELTLETAEKDVPEFLTASGEHVPDNKAAFIAVFGANTQTPNTILFHAGETLTLTQTLGGKVQEPYCTLCQLSTTGGNNVYVVRPNEYGTAYPWTIDAGMLHDFVEDSDAVFADNPLQRNKANANGGASYGKITLNAKFQYKDAKIKVNQPEGVNAGTLVFSGTSRPASDSLYGYHRGDTVYITCDMDPAYSGSFHFAGVEVRVKANETDTVYSDNFTVWAENGGVYLDRSEEHRLNYGYYEVTPIYSYNDNSVAIRVREDDVRRFDQTTGIFGSGRTPARYTVVRENNVRYRQYIMNGSITAGKIYSFTAQGINGTVTPIWRETGSETQYGGNCFYFTAYDRPERNIIYLTPAVRSAGFTPTTLRGNLLRYGYNAGTGRVSQATTDVISGALAACGDSYSYTDDLGAFELTFTAAADTKVRYLICINGETSVYEADINEASYDGNINKKLIVNPEAGTVLSDMRISVKSGSYNGALITLNDSVTTMEVSDLGGFPYVRTVVLPDGTFAEQNALERITDAVFIVRAADGTLHGEYPASGSNGTFTANLSQSDIADGDNLYIKVITDRVPTGLSHVDENGNPTADGVDGYTEYYEVYAGYSFVQSNKDIVPILHKIDPLPNIDFCELPLIGPVGYYFEFPYVHMGIEQRENDYILTVGIGVMDIVDTLKGTHISEYDNGGIYKSMFKQGAEGVLDGFVKGMKNSSQLNNTIKQAAKEGANAGAGLGGKSWRFNVAVGMYLRFTLLTATGGIYETSPRTDWYFTGMGGYIGVMGGFRFTQYFVIPVIFVPGYWGIQIDANIMGYFGTSADPNRLEDPDIVLDDMYHTELDFGDWDAQFDASVKGTAMISIFAGTGICGIVGIRGGGRMIAIGLWEPTGRDDIDDIGGMITFSAGIWVDTFVMTIPLQYTFADLRFGSIKQWSEMPDENPTGEEGELQLRDPYTDSDSDWVGNKPTLQAGFSEVSTKVLVENPYEYPDAQLLTLKNGKVLLAYVDAAETDDPFDRTELKIVSCTGGKWGTPVSVRADGTSDFQPKLCEMDDGKVLITWVSTDPAVERDGTIECFLRNLEIYSAVIDADTLDVSEITQLTTDEYYDCLPIPCYDDESGEYAVFYVKADPNNYDGSGDPIPRTAEELLNIYANDSSIVYMLHADPGDGSGARWLKDYYYETEYVSEEDRDILISDWNGQRFLASPITEIDGMDAPNIADLTLTAYNGLAALAFTIDRDSSSETSEDRELFIQYYDFSDHQPYVPVRLTKDSVSDTIPQFARSGGDDAETFLFWLRNDNNVTYLSVTDLIRCGVDEDGNILPDYKNSNVHPTTGDYERLYSYVLPGECSIDEHQSMANFRAAVDGRDIYIVWSQIPEVETGEFDCVELYATALIRSAETADTGTSWSNPYRLTTAHQVIDYPMAAVDADGNLIAVYTRYNQELTDNPENPVEISDLVLCTSRMEPCGAVDVDEITLSDDAPFAGEEITVTVAAVNNGLTFADGYELTVIAESADGSETVIGTVSSDTPMVPAGKDEQSFKWTVPESFSGTVIRTEIRETGGSWSNVSTFETEPIVPHAQIEITDNNVYQDGDTMRLSFAANNNGNGTSTAEDTFRVMQVGPYCSDCGLEDDEHIFAETSLAGIAPNESRTFDIILNAPDKAFEQFGYVTCLADVLSGGESVRSTSITVKPSSPLNVRLNGSDIPANLTLSAGQSMETVFTTVPADGNSTVILMSSDSDIVNTEDGRIAAGSVNGTAEITGLILPSGVTVGPIRVTVTGGQTPLANDRNVPDGGADTPTPVPGEDEKRPIVPRPVIPSPSDTDIGTDPEPSAPVVNPDAPAKPVNPFKDVSESDWFYDAVQQVCTDGMMIGTSATEFSPYSLTTRAQIVTILYRLEGEPALQNDNVFTDVVPGSWYEKAVVWANGQGIVNGFGDGTFGPNQSITREQFAAILYRYAGYKGYDVSDGEDTDLSGFADTDSVSGYALPAMKWACGTGLIVGDGGYLKPRADANRAQAATIFCRFCNRYQK